MNKVELCGMICKEPIYRETPLGRAISDVLLAVKRLSGDWDYIPCIFWGENARKVKDLELGASLKVVGRIQSRKYTKVHTDGTKENKIFVEVSVSKLDIVN